MIGDEERKYEMCYTECKKRLSEKRKALTLNPLPLTLNVLINIATYQLIYFLLLSGAKHGY